MINVSNPKAQYLKYASEINDAIKAVLDSGNYVLGPNVERFENEFAKYCNVDYCIGVGTGTDALILSLKALGIGKDDEVICPSLTATATVAAIAVTGATPVLVDIDPEYFTISIDSIKRNINKNTKAIIPVHLYGQMADMPQIMQIAKKHNLKVIEDCAQAHGAYIKVNDKIHMAGSFGDLNCFSFYPTKNLGAIGDGGAIVTKDKKLRDSLLQLRQYGWDENRYSQQISNVTRLDELQAAILNVKLKYLNNEIDERNQIAASYNECLNNLNIGKNINIVTPKTRNNYYHSYHLYVIKTNIRNDFINYLKENEINTAIHYSHAVHQDPSFKNIIKIDLNNLKNTEDAVSNILSLPIYPGLEPSVIINTIIHYNNQGK